MQRTIAGLVALAAAATAGAAEPVVLPVWPGAVPGETAPPRPQRYQPIKPNELAVKRLTDVDKPTLTVHAAPADKANGTAVVICPGGGYNILADEHEGDDAAKWLNSLGVTAGVLRYRVPRRSHEPKDTPPLSALQDAQRAVSLLRHRAAEFGVDPQRVGVLGFSAGGNLAARVTTLFENRSYDAADDADRVPCRPDFAILVYPAYMVDKSKPDGITVPISKATPPTCFIHTGDDQYSSEGSALMYLALKRVGVPAELHVYEKGGHGYGMREGKLPINTWPARCGEWLAARGLLTKK